MNYKIEQLHQQMVDLINNSGIPVIAAVYVLKDCLRELEGVAQQVLRKEAEEQEDSGTEPAAEEEGEL